MNSLDDLRSTLDQHAGTVSSGVGTAGRTSAVHERVRVVRRRRRVGAAAGTAAVLAVVGGVALLPRDTDREVAPTGPSELGIDLPQELESVGFTYEYAGTATGDGQVSMRLPASDEPRLVTWGTADGSDAVTVTDDDDPAVVHDAPDFTDWVLVEAGRKATVSVSQVDGESEGKVVLAYYTLGDQRPSGVSGEGLTYRSQTAEGVLLAAEVGISGQGEMELAATASTRATRLHFSCTGLDDDNLVMHEESSTGTSSGDVDCSGPLPVDGVTGEASAFTTSPGDDVTTRFYVTRGEDGPIVDDPRLSFAAAIYALDAPVTSALRFAPTIEHGGHRWTLAGSEESTDGALSLAAPDDNGAVVVTALAKAEGAGEAEVALDLGGSRRNIYVTRDATPIVTELVGPGAQVSTALEGSTGDGDFTVATALGFYTRAD